MRFKCKLKAYYLKDVTFVIEFLQVRFDFIEISIVIKLYIGYRPVCKLLTIVDIFVVLCSYATLHHVFNIFV